MKPASAEVLPVHDLNLWLKFVLFNGGGIDLFVRLTKKKRSQHFPLTL